MPQSAFAADLHPDQKAELIREIYRKHTAELLALEDAQQKMVLLILGIVSAIATLLVSDKVPRLPVPALAGLSLILVGMIWIGWRYAGRRDKARHDVRQIIVDCEKAMGLYDPGVFLQDPCSPCSPALYPADLANFPVRGYWLSRTFGLAVLAAVGLLLILWAGYLQVPLTIAE